MKILRALGYIFLLPGNIALNAFNITITQDGGIFRSMINMIFWGIVAMFVMLPFVAK